MKIRPVVNEGPVDSSCIWVPRKKLRAEAPPLPLPKTGGGLRRLLKERQALFLTLGIIIAGALPFLVRGKDVRIDVSRKWLHQEQILEEPESRESSQPETAGIEIQHDSFKKDVRNLLRTLGDEGFESPEEVATGRFLVVLDQGIQLIRGIDLEKIRLLQQEGGWARIEAIYRPFQRLTDPEEIKPEEEEKFLILELVEEEARWKLENLKLTSRRSR